MIGNDRSYIGCDFSVMISAERVFGLLPVASR
jgi:hypothetical protein